MQARENKVKTGLRMMCLSVLGLGIAICGWGQSSPDHASTEPPKTDQTETRSEKKAAQPGKEMGKGGEDVGKGVAKGTGDLAKGTANGVGNLARGNVGSAGASFGKGVGGFGKNVAVGTGKGVGKIGKGVGGEFKKLHHRSKPPDD